jgi:hypothetical protein
MRSYVDEIAPGTAFSVSSRPSLMKHIDGPMLVFRDGQMHWLTLFERFLVWVGRATPESIERKRRPNLVKLIESWGPNPAARKAS